MQIRKKIFTCVVAILLASPFVAFSQYDSALSTFSPYTFYGIGDLSNTSPTFLKSMGGAGIATGSYSDVNFLNPASYSSVNRNSFLLSVGVEGGGLYLKDSEGASTSYNTYNFSEVSFKMPIYQSIGLGVSVSPYSSVGYNCYYIEYQDAEYNAVMRQYWGEGGVSQFRVGVGAKLAKGLSVGVNGIYYFGTINRYFSTSVLSNYEGISSLSSVVVSQREHASRILPEFGLQYDLLVNKKRALTFGATYNMGGSLNMEVNRQVPSVDMYGSYVLDSTYTSNYAMPDIITAGFYYSTPKFGIAADYSYAAWEGINDEFENEYVTYTNTHTVKVGGHYTPNRMDVRHLHNRITYRLGFNYSTYYMKVNNTDIDSKAVTFGVGIPMKLMGASMINVGVELGKGGTTASGLYDQKYFKVSIGLSLFGEDYWFIKQKYD